MKKSWKKALLAGLSIVMMGSFIAGCGSDNNGAANKDVLKVGVTNFASTLEPTENFFAWVVMRYGVGETLAKFDEQMKPQPWIASKWEVSPDHKTWTFTINDKVKFSNGKKVDAAAVKASIERAFEKSNRAKTFFEYDSIEANGQQLVIHTTKEYPNMPGLLADPLFLIVDVQAEKDGRNFAKEGPIGTGPYVVKSFTKERAEMAANENYWDGTVPFKTVEIPSIDDPNTRAISLQSGDVDMAVNIGPGEIGLFQGNDKFKVDEIASLRVVLARINQKGILGDDKVRAAVISATDRKNYADVLLKGTFIPGSAPIPPSMDYGFKDLKDGHQKLIYNETDCKLNWQYMRLKLDTELREYVEFQCQDKIWDMRGIAVDTVDGYGRIDNLINPLFWVGTDTNRRVFFYIDSVVVSQE